LELKASEVMTTLITCVSILCSYGEGESVSGMTKSVTREGLDEMR
jgi:hypothetical protein